MRGKWDYFDMLVAAGVPVTLVKPDGTTADWSELV